MYPVDDSLKNWKIGRLEIRKKNISRLAPLVELADHFRPRRRRCRRQAFARCRSSLYMRREKMHTYEQLVVSY